MLTRRIPCSLAPVVVLAAACFAAPAYADEPHCQLNPVSGECVIEVIPPAGGGGNGGGSGGGGEGGGGTGKCIDRTWRKTPKSTACTQKSPRYNTKTWWSNSRQCYIGLAPADEQKDPDYWEGHRVGGPGAIYFCEPPARIGGAGMLVTFFWSATPPAGPAAPPDPRQLARRAIASMRLRAVDIGIVPEDEPGRVGVIGLPTWMWVSDPGQHTMGPITRTASTGGFTVTATAKVKKMVWNMGDGTSVTCNGAGTPYADSYGRRSSPTCGHTYTRDGRYTVSARSYWVVEWSGLGQSGEIPLDFTRSTTIRMGEVQVLVQ